MACWFFRFATYIIYFLYFFGDETCKKWRSHLANLHASEAATNPSEEMSHQDIETLWWSGNRGRFYTFWRMDFYVSLKAPHWIDLAYIWHILAQWYWNWIEIGWFGCEHNSIIFNWFGSMPKNPFFYHRWHIYWMIGQSHGDFFRRSHIFSSVIPQELVAQVKVVYDVINVMARSPWVKHRWSFLNESWDHDWMIWAPFKI